MTAVVTPAYSASAAAPALQYATEARAASRTESQAAIAVEPSPPPLTRKAITYQPSLFSSREFPRVVPFETIAPETLEAPPRKTVRTKRRVRPRRVIPGQQNLEFAPTAGSASYIHDSNASIYCDAPVAGGTHRAVATVLDGSLIFIALALFGVTFYLAGGAIALNSKTLPLLAMAAGLVTLFYKLLWCMANGDSPGMKGAHLTLVNFDGQRPNRLQRFQRLTSGFLSLFAAGLGLLWALVDEETLTWHDHISRTFPTPY